MWALQSVIDDMLRRILLLSINDDKVTMQRYVFGQEPAPPFPVLVLHRAGCEDPPARALWKRRKPAVKFYGLVIKHCAPVVQSSDAYGFISRGGNFWIPPLKEDRANADEDVFDDQDLVEEEIDLLSSAEASSEAGVAVEAIRLIPIVEPNESGEDEESASGWFWENESGDLVRYEMIEQAQIGALQIARISVGAMGPVVDEVNVFNMPFVFRDEAHMRKVIDGPIGQDLLERMTNGPGSRLVALGWMDAGTRNVYAKKAVTTPEDLKGMKIRMMGNPLFVETMNAMGGNGVAMGFNELLPALQTGVVDGAENNPPTLLAQNHYTVSKVMSLTGHLIIPEIFVFSKKSWEGLSKDDQALVKKLSAEAQQEQRKLWDDYTKEAETKLKALGVQFAPADKAAFFKATQPIRDKYGSKYATLIKKIQDTK
jgi:tripartite ATP-independent transporter DctP family solute receptor